MFVKDYMNKSALVKLPACYIVLLICMLSRISSRISGFKVSRISGQISIRCIPNTFQRIRYLNLKLYRYLMMVKIIQFLFSC
jgi:hypothetical protein